MLPPDVLLGLVLASQPLATLDPALIRGVVRGHAAQVRVCYENELKSHPKLQGKLVVKFTIQGSGAVASSSVMRSTVHNPRLERCISRHVRTWVFPRPMRGEKVAVTYPFVLKQSGE